MRRLVISMLLLLLAVLVWRLWPSDVIEAPVAGDTLQTSRAPAAAAATPPAAPPWPVGAPPITSTSARDDAYEALLAQVDGRTVSCSSDALQDGIYHVRAEGIGFAMVYDGVFTALVETEQGSAVLEQDLRAMGQVSWSGASCSIHIQWVLVRGQVLWADGQPAARHALPSCDFGEWLETDDDGLFETEVLYGTQCSLIAFVETETEFGRSPSALVDASTDEPITLTLPQTLWSKEEQALFAAQLAELTWRSIEQRYPADAPRTPAQQALDTVDDEAAQLLQAWQGLRDIEEAAMHEHASRLADPAEQLDALKESFYQQY